MTDTAQPVPGGRLPVRVWEIVAPQMVIVFGVAVAVLAGIVALVVLKAGMPHWDVDAFVKTLPTNLYVVVITTGVLYLVMIAVLVAICRRRGPATFTGYYGRFSGGQFLGGAIIGALLAVGVSAGLAWLDRSHIVSMDTNKAEDVLTAARDPRQLALALSVIGLIGPIAEEVYFRGLLLAWLRRGLWVPLAALADAAMFSAVHYQNAMHPGAEGWVLSGVIATVGLLNAIFYLRTRSLWMPTGLHMSYNATLVLLSYFA
ncbi:MAG TPA: CPBP family intramembrane glutamic endopeptidase [Rhizomicrobium sp.]|nr:CPBP family intramembrane glutamic endopeptidase [Rhizomicrobium sp.]